MKRIARIFGTVFAALLVAIIFLVDRSSWAVTQIGIGYTNCPCDTAIPNGVAHQNIRALPTSAHDQLELSIAASRSGSRMLLLGAMTRFRDSCKFSGSYTVSKHLGYYFSSSASSWTGPSNDTLPESFPEGWDPSVAFMPNGRAYYAYLKASLDKVTYVDWTDDSGVTWNGPVPVHGSSIESDKPQIMIGKDPSVSGRANVYVGYTDESSSTVTLGRSTDSGQTFSHQQLSASGRQAVTMAVGRLGQLYTVWAQGVTELNGYSGIQFSASYNGGLTFTDASTITSADASFKGLRHLLKPMFLKSNGYPVVAVDTSGGEYDSTIYVVWADIRNGTTASQPLNAFVDWDPDVFLMRSIDGGANWSNPIRVNSDSLGNGKDQWLPWVEVDPYGGVNVVFYDSRSDMNDIRAEAWIARSLDGGQTFSDNRCVSNVSFTPCGSDGYFSGWVRECDLPPNCEPWEPVNAFIGDYLGIASDLDYTYPCWSDNRIRRQGGSSQFGLYQAFVAPISLWDTLAGNISVDTVLRGNFVLKGDITVDSGVTVTMSRNSRFNAVGNSDSQNGGVDPNRVELIVRGALVIDLAGKARPLFTSSSMTRGSWYGIRVLNGGRVKGGVGARIEYAQVGLTIDTVTTADTLRGFNIRTCQIAGVITRSDAVAFENDTISDVPSGYGIQIDHADPSVTGVQISNCQYGIYAVASESRVRDSRIVGPGSYGIYTTQDVELPSDYDTLYVTKVSDSGYFTGAHMWAGYKAHAIIDSCRFVTDTTAGIRSPYGVKAGESVYVKLRRSLIRDFGSAGFHSFKTKANLGTTKGASGNNSIHAVPVWLYDEELGWWSINPKRVYHTGNTSTDTLRAEDNWWGSSTPPSNWFTSLVDYNPYLATDPGLGKIAPGTLVSENQALPREFTLGQNYPNPFNGTTVIEYEIHAAGEVRLAVYNVLGQLVRSLIDEAQSAGHHRAEWNGRDEHGRELASGVYFYRMQSDRQVNSKKMVLLK